MRDRNYGCGHHHRPLYSERCWVLCCAVLSHVRLFVTPWTVARQAPPSVGFSRQEYWNGLPRPPPGDPPHPGRGPTSPALQVDSLLSESPGKSYSHLNDWNLLIYETFLKHSHIVYLLIKPLQKGFCCDPRQLQEIILKPAKSNSWEGQQDFPLALDQVKLSVLS